MIVRLVLFISIFGLFNYVNGAKILGIFPTPSKSHWILGSALMKELANSGHEITMISPFPLKSPHQNYKDIDIGGTGGIQDFFGPKLDNISELVNRSMISKVFNIYNTGYLLAKFTLTHPNIQKLLKSNAEFDLIILEIFLNEAYLGFSHHYNAPVVAISTIGCSKWINDLIGSPKPLSYIPLMHLDLTDRMTFRDRLLNTIVSILEIGVMELSYNAKQNNLYEEIFVDPKPTLSELKKNAVSLALLNSHFSLSFPQPSLPNMIEVGGMHINTKPNPLPDDVKRFIDGSKDGVIYFSMGSNLKPSKFPKEKIMNLHNVLSNLKQKVLWKWDDPDSFKKSDNMMISSWFPQDDILNHPNVRLFITHGGLLSCTESIYHGVPVVGIPMFGDQQMNMAKVVTSGWGLRIDFKNITTESIQWAVTEVIENPKYKEKAKAISQRYRDQPLPPMELAKFWIEYVIRHKGAPHLHSAGQDLNFIQYHMIDVFATIFSAIFIVLWLLFTIIKFFLKLFCSKKKIDKNIKKKKNK